MSGGDTSPFGQLPVLQGEPDVVAAATEARDEIVSRLARGTSLMGVEGQVWAEELKGSFSRRPEASWWLENRSQFAQIEDDTALVQIVFFGTMDIPGVPTVLILVD